MRVPDPSLGLLIISARQAMRQTIGARARRYRLTTPQFWGLVGLHWEPGLTPGELGGWMRLDPPAASRLVADLTGRKLVEARPDRADRRRTHLFLTAKGETLAAELAVIAQAYHEASIEGLTAEQVAALREGLRRVAENLARFDARDPGAAPRANDPAER